MHRGWIVSPKASGILLMIDADIHMWAFEQAESIHFWNTRTERKNTWISDLWEKGGKSHSF